MTLNASILTIGDEICIGQIVNTNAAWIAQKLTSLGLTIHSHVSIGDSIDEMIGEIDRLLKRSPILIITGGLGPTHDDCTKEALCQYLGDSLVLHPETLTRLEEYYRARNRIFGERQRGQAMVPKTCQVLPNAMGTAPGMKWEIDRSGETRRIYSLPGVPVEMKYLMSEHILPELESLQEKAGHAVVYKTLLTSGIGESDLADQIGDVREFLGNDTLAFLPQASGVRLRIGVERENKKAALERLAELETHLRSKVARYIFGENDDTLAQALGRVLLQKKWTLSTAESCTGGMIGSLLTDVSGSSAYYLGGAVTYSNELKHDLVGVPKELIQKHGAVSQEVVEAMVCGAIEKFKSDASIAVSGISGPTGGTAEKPVGTTWISVATPHGVKSRCFQFGTNSRAINRERAASAALLMLYRTLTEMP